VEPDAELAEGFLRLLQRERRLCPCLRRDAANAQARPTKLWRALDARHACTELCRTDRSGIAPRAAPENGDVDFHHKPPVGSQLLVGEELADGCGDLIYVRLECEVACV